MRSWPQTVIRVNNFGYGKVGQVGKKNLERNKDRLWLFLCFVTFFDPLSFSKIWFSSNNNSVESDEWFDPVDRIGVE